MNREEWYMLLAQWSQNPEQSRKRVLNEVLHERGIPKSLRGSLWLVASGAEAKRSSQPSLFRTLMNTPIEMDNDTSVDLENCIWKDVHRTFPLFRSLFPELTMTNRSVEKVGTGKYHQHEIALFHVLKAVAQYLYETGYHQGMNFIAAVSLLVLHVEPGTDNTAHDDDSVDSSNEKHVSHDSNGDAGTKRFDEQQEAESLKLSESWFEAAEGSFWLLICLLDDMHLQGLFQVNSSFLQQFVDQFEILVRRFMPRLARHMNVALESKFEVVLFAMDWFTTLFSYSLQFETLVLVWDCLIVCQLDEALYIAGLAILLIISPDVEGISSFSDLMENFKSLVQGIGAQEFRDAMLEVVSKLLGTPLMPFGKSTLMDIKSRLGDPDNVITLHQYDARQLLLGVQLNNAEIVEAELLKYTFPIELLENALLKATFLGHAKVLVKLVDVGGCDPDCRSTLRRFRASENLENNQADFAILHDPGGNTYSDQPLQHIMWLGSGFTPLHICAILGHPTCARVLLSRGARVDARCKDPAIRSLVASQRDLARGNMRRVLMHYHSLAQSVSNAHPSSQEWLSRNQVGVTPAELASAISRISKNDRSAVSRVLEGDICVQCGGVLKRHRTGFWSMMASSFVAQEPGALDRLDRTSPISVARNSMTRAGTGPVLVHSVPGFGRVKSSTAGSAKRGMDVGSVDVRAEQQKRRQALLAKNLPPLCWSCGKEWIDRVHEDTRSPMAKSNSTVSAQKVGDLILGNTNIQDTEKSKSGNSNRLPRRPTWQSWQKIASCDLDAPGLNSAWRCQHCKILASNKRAGRWFKCYRCNFSFCSRCADTMRSLRPKHPNPVRVCRNCHHFLQSCPCPQAADDSVLDNRDTFDAAASVNGSQFCQHRPSDYFIGDQKQPTSSAMTSFCECEQCIERRYVVHDPLVRGPRALYHRHRKSSQQREGKTSMTQSHPNANLNSETLALVLGNKLSPNGESTSSLTPVNDSVSQSESPSRQSVTSNASAFGLLNIVLPSPSGTNSIASQPSPAYSVPGFTASSVPGFAATSRHLSHRTSAMYGASLSGTSIAGSRASGIRRSRHRQVDPTLAPLEGCNHYPFNGVFTQGFQPTDTPERFVLRIIAELYERTLRKSNAAMRLQIGKIKSSSTCTRGISPNPVVQKARSQSGNMSSGMSDSPSTDIDSATIRYHELREKYKIPDETGVVKQVPANQSVKSSNVPNFDDDVTKLQNRLERLAGLSHENRNEKELTSTVSVPSDGVATVSLPSDGVATVPLPSDGVATVSLPSDGVATVPLPSDGVATVSLPSDGIATVPLPSDGVATVSLPSDGVATVSLPSDGVATVPLPSDGVATVPLPSDGVATVSLPSDGVATVPLPSDGVATVSLPNDGVTTISLPSDGVTTMSLPSDGVTTMSLPSEDHGNDTVLQQLRAIYAEYQPAKLDKLESKLKRYNGKEAELLEKLKGVYGVE